ncbi:flagellar biosynthetic protein FliQ [candidate division LCP-89 bacterium B3_LCP]|uniref:Flagellar biosynthetic protein FliQ n=1 Tax=candidate division LCP-89 bacterium B3_LCP TaxID=2012998 RepID=A0A532V4X0_UNCL8|nr:MAG: flagellar biosynthetic protein FliQ [candidate division LCP-89 bacterium B3_LCP]
MTQQMAIAICKDAVWTALFVAAPMLGAGLIVGITISILQSVTQIQEMTLTFIPKILAVTTVLIFALPWIMNMLISFTNEVFALLSVIK